MKRRHLLFGLGLSGLVTPFLARSTVAQEETEDTVDYLFVQNSKHATLADGLLRLSDVNPSTLYFSDRPERIVGHVGTKRFVDHWASGANSFEADPPNATLSVASGDLSEEVVVVIRNPELQGVDLVYQVEVLEGPSAVKGGPCSLFIDMLGNPMSPMSVAGSRRRRRRRRRHAILN
jgi:hypothetical protein